MTTYVEVAQTLVEPGYLSDADIEAAATVLADALLVAEAEDAEALDCVAEVQGARDILTGGNSASRQRAVHAAALKASGDKAAAHRAVITALIDEFTADL